MNYSPPGGLPHNYPFKFIESIVELNGRNGVAVKKVSANDAVFISGKPALPDILIVEALAQLAGLVLNFDKAEKTSAYLAQIKGFRFTKTVTAGDSLLLTAEMLNSFSGLASFAVRALVDDAIAAEGELVMAADAAIYKF